MKRAEPAGHSAAAAMADGLGGARRDGVPQGPTRRGFLAGMGAAMLSLHAPHAAGAAAAAEPCNVVVLMSDEHNHKYCGPMGHPLLDTPNLRRIAQRGTVFENAYCPSPLCAPSRSSFLSGLRVHGHGQYGNCSVFRASHPTYAQALAAAGVHTVHAGKADFYRNAGECGFAEVLLPGDRTPPGDTSVARDPLFVRTGEGLARAPLYGPRDGDPYADDHAVAGAALDWLTARAPHVGKPFTLCVNIGRPHFPHYVRPDQWERYAAGADLPRYGLEQPSAQHPYAEDLRRHFETAAMTEEHIRGHRRGYLGCVEFADEVAGRFLDAIERAGLASNTVFIYTSDHGEMLGKFGLWWKSSLYDDSARVPLFAVGPGFAPGARVRTPVDLHDMQAGLFHATGAARPAGWCGAPLQTIAADDPGRIVFSEYHGHGTRASAYMVRQGPWKLLWYAAAPHQLFNLDEDPEELHNFAEAAPDRFRALQDALYAVCDPMAENARAEARIREQIAAFPA